MTVASISSILELPDGLPRTESRPQHGEVADVELFTVERTHVAQKLEALGEMISGIAHDFRNILAVIDAGLRLAERNLNQPELVQHHIDAARDGIARGAKLTTQLISFARRQELEARSGNVNEWLTNLEPLLRYSAGARNPIDLDLQKNLPECVIDSTQFDVAILNLVNNARDAMSVEGGEIRIKTELFPCETCSYVRVRVEDHGSGMSPEVLKKVFDPFFTTKGEKGSGIGLPQVDAFMKLVGGHINVTSELGQGTTVDLMFPAVYSVTSAVEARATRAGRLTKNYSDPPTLLCCSIFASIAAPRPDDSSQASQPRKVVPSYSASHFLGSSHFPNPDSTHACRDPNFPGIRAPALNRTVGA